MIRRGKRASVKFNTPFLVTSAAKSVRTFVAQDARVQRALELLPQVPAAPINDIAKSLNLSASRFRHLFKEELGMSLRHYLRLARLERAKELLENSFLRVKEVTALVGVNDMSHFVRAYKALYGQTPSQTRAVRQGSDVESPKIAVKANK